MQFGHTIKRPALLAALALATVALFAILSSGAVTTAAQAASCGETSKSNGYITNITASRTSCSKAKKVAKAYDSCRLRKGKKGKCTRSVSGGYRCTEKRTTVSTEINGLVTCKKGSARVKFAYQQNL